ncbi:MAG: ABC transporter permease [Actinomycetaceae bacterium]|nr:ABC transporter permease [Actinomycetaceae bacterium]
MSHRSWLAPTLLGAFLLVGWWITAASGRFPAFVMPHPLNVAKRAVQELTGPYLWGYLGNTLAEALVGCLVGLSAALPLAYLIYKSTWANAAVQPFLGATQAIPAVALAPLLLLWMGSGLRAIVTLCALMVFFPILVTTTVGLRHLDRDLIDAAKLDGAWGWTMLRSIEAPLVLPSMMAGLRNGFTLSITGAVVGEMVMGGHGMGTLITLQSHNVDTTGMFVSLLIICTIAAIAYGLIYQAERRSKTIAALTTQR